jgi:hypothetical protein
MQSPTRTKAIRRECLVFNRNDPYHRTVPVEFVVSMPLEMLIHPAQVEK